MVGGLKDNRLFEPWMNDHVAKEPSLESAKQKMIKYGWVLVSAHADHPKIPLEYL